ncbi:type VI secretion system Vgr family protein [Pseudomonas fluorescens]|uniref:Phage late control gene D protein (GPD) n=2 Tax=Pseudomonas fluorescens TaxID=294 RepID=A0ABY1THV4_PSEFL|nr:type VI secretion system Vgr family protein [Pseudomonas fluorescens]MCI4606626.1 type VI secretion system Vgr family protein [Pseudomonas fluorescens]PQA91728.1 hypothetical protein B0A76_28585 [Pseudomonas fluorescens]RFP93436.1 type VI secretion system tip protein VgrG [Pseudomonas fluorescens]RMO69802.1 hypothetical protein ALQ35_01504 [Pseudomonas fluorescens]TWR46079.1 type VI secretion system tip protein VgrG [Pseudomonas fluorescens]
MTLTEQPLCTFLSDGLALEPLLVARWQGEDVLSRPYRFEVVLASLNPLLNEDAMLGAPAHLTLFDTLGAAHPYHGIVTSVELLDADDLYHYCRVVLEPRITRLRQQRFSEIWLDKNLPELLRDILKNADLTREGQGADSTRTAAFDFDLRLRDDDIPHTQANFTCQYEETSFDFLSRLLEYSGCYYFFEQQEQQEALIFCSDRSAQPKALLPVRYRPLDTALNSGLAAVAHTFSRRSVVQPEQVVLQDFSASNAQLALHSTASVAAGSVADNAQAPATSPAFSGEFGVYGEHFGSHAQGLWLAQRRAQALGCRHRLFQGSGHVTGLRSGGLMALAGHARPCMNAAYQVLEVHHSGQQPLPATGEDNLAGDTQTRFLVIPAEVQFRPPLDTPKPNAFGVLSAVVDGDDSGKPLLNQHGCYKVRFPFTRDQKPSTRGSAWLRRVSLSAGSSHGMHFPLLKGSEVLVSFLGGDPDRPIIVGCVPNSENPSMVVERNATQSGFSTAGGHFLAMEDHPGAAHLKLGAPGGNSVFTLGNGEVAGAQLRTNAHMQLTSSSLKHEVPGVYSLSMGTGDPVAAHSSDTGADNPVPASPAEPKPTPGELNTGVNWGGPNWLNLGAKAEFTNAPTFSASLKTATTQAEASLGVAKLSLTAQGKATTVNMSGVSISLSCNGFTYVWEKIGKKVAAISEDKKLIDRTVASVSQLQAELHKVTADLYTVTATTSITLKCAEHSIVLNPDGIRIQSPKTIMIDGDVAITGKTRFVGNVDVVGDIHCKNASVSSQLKATYTSLDELSASNATLGAVYIPPTPTEALIEAEEIARLKAFEVLNEMAEALARGLDDGANAALQVVDNFEP